MKNKKMVRFSVLALLLLFCVGGASASSDGFEDGDYSSNPPWNVLSTGDSVSVSNTVSAKGSFSLKLDSNSNSASKIQHSGSLDVSKDSVVFYARRDSGVLYYSLTDNSGSTGGGANDILFRIKGNNALSVITYNSTGGLEGQSGEFGSYSQGSWAKIKLDFNDSNKSLTVNAFDLNDNSIGSATVAYSGHKIYNYIVLQEPSFAPGVAYYDDVKYSLNQKPQFNSTSITPDPPLIGENVSYSAEVYDPDSSVDYTNLSLSYGGSTVLSDEQRTGTTSPVWNDVFTPQDSNKWLNATLEVVDDSGAVTTKEINRYLSDENPNVTVNSPDTSIKDSNTVSWNVSTENKDSDPNEALDLKIYKNGNLENTYSNFQGRSSRKRWKNRLRTGQL